MPGESPLQDISSQESDLTVRVHTPGSPLRQPGRLLADIFRDLWRTRELMWILFCRDLKAQFRQSALGYTWLVVPPLVSAAAWFILNRAGLMKIETGGQHVAQFVVVGTTIWAAFSATLTTPMDAIEGSKTVFTKLDVPIETFILSAAGRAAFNLLISSAVLLILLFCLGVSVRPSFLLFPFAAFAALAMAFTIGILLAPLSTLYTDVRRAVAAFLGLLMFTVPVIFAVPDAGSGIVASIMRNNPLTPAIALSRDTLLTGSLEWLWPTVAWLVVCAPLVLVALIVLRVAKPHIITRMGM
jgi:lipopolysaccharide transport system permease protein